jgi:transposase-like protein
MASKWVRLYQCSGLEGLLDRSSRRLPESMVSQVVELRRGHMPGYEIARQTGLSASSVSRVLRRAQQSRWRDLNPPPPIIRSDGGTRS